MQYSSFIIEFYTFYIFGFIILVSLGPNKKKEIDLDTKLSSGRTDSNELTY